MQNPKYKNEDQIHQRIKTIQQHKKHIRTIQGRFINTVY